MSGIVGGMVAKGIFLVFMAMLATGSALALDLDDSQRAVWKMEEAYWRYVSAGDVDACDLRPEAVKLFGEDVAVVHDAAGYVFGYPDGKPVRSLRN